MFKCWEAMWGMLTVNLPPLTKRHSLCQADNFLSSTSILFPNIVPLDLSKITIFCEINCHLWIPLPIWNEWDFLARQQYRRNRASSETLVSWWTMYKRIFKIDTNTKYKFKYKINAQIRIQQYRRNRASSETLVSCWMIYKCIFKIDTNTNTNTGCFFTLGLP